MESLLQGSQKETPIGKLAERPFYLELTDSEMECFIEALKSLVEERKTFLKRLLKFD